MSIEHKIEIYEMTVVDQGDLSNVVLKMCWRVVSKDLETGDTESYATSTSIPKPDETSFLEFSEITEEIALSWLSDSLKQDFRQRQERKRPGMEVVDIEDPFEPFKKMNEEKIKRPPLIPRSAPLPWK